jgi:hypothetical protein
MTARRMPLSTTFTLDEVLFALRAIDAVLWGPRCTDEERLLAERVEAKFLRLRDRARGAQ